MPEHFSSKFALALGRFQPLHNQHMEYLLATAEQGGHLIVGITNPSRILPPPPVTAPHRSERVANPFSYFARFRMVRDALMNEGMGLNDFSIVPAILGSTGLLDTLPEPEDIICCITINDAWGKEKQRIIEESGIRVRVLWERGADAELITGTMIRSRMRVGEPWESFVPGPAAAVVREILRTERNLPRCRESKN
jgi:nicotinamide mononucleotide adenylyltransferase